MFDLVFQLSFLKDGNEVTWCIQFWVGPGKNRLFRNFSFIKFAYLFKMINHTNFSGCLCLIYVSCVCIQLKTVIAIYTSICWNWPNYVSAVDKGLKHAILNPITDKPRTPPSPTPLCASHRKLPNQYHRWLQRKKKSAIRAKCYWNTF
jgi:hypothetical protein